MTIIKENDQYILQEVPETICVANYQLLEKTAEYPKGKTFGVYFLKKDAVKAFDSLAVDPDFKWTLVDYHEELDTDNSTISVEYILETPYRGGFLVKLSREDKRLDIITDSITFVPA